MNKISKTAIISSKAIIGDNCEIGDYVIIHDNVHIGSSVKIYGPNSIGSPAEYKNPLEGHKSGGVMIGENTEIREFVTINASLFIPFTQVGNNCYLMAKSHIGHDSIVGDSCVLSTSSILGGHTRLGNNVNIGLNAVTHQYAILGSYSMLGANAFFKGSSSSGIIWVGTPAEPLKVNSVGLSRDKTLTPTKIDMITKEAEIFIALYNMGEVKL